jgi:tetratricopeptide (TPR) repeat protein
MNLTNAYNPYDFANPVSNADLLVGRDKEMEEINYYLDNTKLAPRPINIALLGQRASGKTSILNITELEAKKRGFCTVRINLDEDDARTQLSFFYKLFDSIASEAFRSGAFGGITGKTYDTYLDIIHAYTIPDDKTFCPFLFPIQYAKAMSSGHDHIPLSDSSFMNDLRKMYDELKHPIILLFDEGNVLVHNRVLLQKLKNIFMNISGYMLVMTGTPDFFPVMDEVFSPIVRQFKRINISEFSNADDTLDCIKKPLESLGMQAEEIFDFETYQDVLDIHNLSGGRPYEIQLICHILFRRVHERRAETMKLDFSVLEEVRRELEKWQDITSRPILTNVRNLTKRHLEALSTLCSCNGKATFEQIWEIEYIFKGESSWKKKALQDVFQLFVNKGILKTNGELILFAGDDFDRIYAKYFAREQGVALNFSSMSIDDYWQAKLNDFINEKTKDSWHVLFDRFNHLALNKNANVAKLLQIFSKKSKIDYFVDLGPVARLLYTFMIKLQDQLEILIVAINPQLPWLNLQAVYWTQKPSDENSLEGEFLVKSLSERIAEIGGDLLIERKNISVAPLDMLVYHVLHTANKSARRSLAIFHQREMFDKYDDPLSREEALLHANLAYQYFPEPSIASANNIGYVFLGADNLDQAENLFNRAIDLCQSDKKSGIHPLFPALPIYNRGVLFAEQGQIEKALDDFQNCINLVQDLNLETREVSWLWVPVWNNETLVFEEQSSPDLLKAAEAAKAAAQSVMQNDNNF